MSFEIRSYSPNTEKVTYTTFSDYAAALHWMGVLNNVGLQSSMTIKPAGKN